VWWCIPVIPAIQEVEIRRIVVQGQPWQKVMQNPISTNEMVYICDRDYLKNN
jgi:hypothetical protein